MKNELTITTSEVIRYLDSISLPQKVNYLLEKANITRSAYDIDASNFANKCLDFAISIKTQVTKYRKELSSAQKRFAITIIKKFANPSQLADWDLFDIKPEVVTKESTEAEAARLRVELADYETRVKEALEELNSVTQNTRDEERALEKVAYLNNKVKRIKADIGRLVGSNDALLKRALIQIKPFFKSDNEDLSRFFHQQKEYAASKGFDWYSSRSAGWERELIISWLSDCREQLDQQSLEKIQPMIPSVAERDQFFVKYTPEYIAFMVNVIKYAIATSVLRDSDDVKEFLASGGVGPHSNKYKARQSLPKWKEAVEKIQKKLDKLSRDGKLANFGDYILSPESFEKIIKEKTIEELSEELSTNIKYTEEQKQVAHAMMKYLASICDYAYLEDTRGFNKPDAPAGHGMADKDELDDEDMARAVFFCNKYRRQLPDEALETLGLIKTKKKKKKDEIVTVPVTVETITTNTAENLARFFAVCINY